MPKPTVAAISGHTLGGTFVLALAYDFRLAARGPFRFGLTKALAGIPFPAGLLTVAKARAPMPTTPAPPRRRHRGAFFALRISA